jgi:signal transduction histidine kinase
VHAVILGALIIASVLAVAHFGGAVYAVPVGLAGMVAFDWYFLPPTHSLAVPDGENAFALAVFILASVLVGEVAARAGRRGAVSEEARSVLADEQAALRRVATLVARQPSAEHVFARVTEEVGRMLHLDMAHLLAYNGDGTATVVSGWGVYGVSMPVGMRLPLEGGSVSARAFRTRGPARQDDYSDAEGPIAEFARSLGIRAAVGTPVVVEGRLWGLMTASTLRPEPIPMGAESRIGAFTELIATAISNAEARRELEWVAAEHVARDRVATLVAVAAPTVEIFAAVVGEVAELFDVPLVALFRYDQNGTATVVAASGDLSAYAGRTWGFPPDDAGVLASVLRTGRPMRIDDYADAGGAGHDIVGELGVGSAVGVPVIVGGRVWGALTMGLAKGRPPLPARMADRVTGFTDLVTTAIVNADARNEIGRLAEEQAALRRVATLVARGVQPGEVFRAVAEEIGRVMEIEVSCVVRYEADATATIVAIWGDDLLTPVGSRWNLEGESVIGQVFRTGRSARMDSYDDASGELAELARRTGRRSFVGAPIVIGDRLWGAAVANSGSEPMPPAAEERIASFADLVATAITNAETRAELAASRSRVVAAADETRRRIERDLHDGIQQRLVSLVLKLRATETMAPRPSDEIQGELSLIADDLGTALDELREISRGIHPAILSEAGLVPALKALARRSAVPVALDLQLESRLEEHLEVAAYYVASEALTNAVKHAQASSIELRVDRRDGALLLSVRDDGVGGADPSRGSGIIGLADRVEALGGTISVRSPSGDGTTLHVQIPAESSTAPTPAAPGGRRAA